MENYTQAEGYVVGDNIMVPRLEAGDEVYITKDFPKPKDLCLIKFCHKNEPTYRIREFVGMEDDVLVATDCGGADAWEKYLASDAGRPEVRQYRWPMDRIVSVHRITGVGYCNMHRWLYRNP